MRLLFLKLKQNKDIKNICFKGSYFKIQKCSFSGVNQFFSVLAFKTIDTQMLFWSVLLKTHKKLLLTSKHSQNGVFDGQKLFLVRFQKYQPKDHLCVNCF